MVSSPQIKVIAAMPAYNEERYIGTMVLKTKQYVDEVIVFDDGSTDKTSEIAKLAGATILQHPQRKGKGAAIQGILTEVKKRAPDALILLDADSQHNPDEIPRFITSILEGADLVIGTRKAQANKTPGLRKIGQKVLLYSTHILSKKELTDSESGFRALSSKTISDVSLTENGFAVETEMIVKAADKGLKITEVPISNIYIKDGSTMNPFAHGSAVFTRTISMISERKPLFFFGLGGGTIIVLGLIAGIRVLQTISDGGVLPVGTTLLSALLLIVGILSIFTGMILRVLTKNERR